jgi:hypothetical protein
VKKRSEITSANVPSPNATGSRWRKRVSERVTMAHGLEDLRRLRRMEFRYKYAPSAFGILLLMAVGYVAGYLVGAGLVGGK